MSSWDRSERAGGVVAVRSPIRTQSISRRHSVLASLTGHSPAMTAHVTRAFDLSAQVYSQPADVTTVRFAAGYIIR